MKKARNRLDNLVLVIGQTFEMIIDKLSKAGVNYDRKDSSDCFFRSHLIRIDHPQTAEQNKRTAKSEVIELLGQPDVYSCGNLFYYAQYEVKDGFDWSTLDGKITFKKGLLVERTKVVCKYN